MCRGPAAGAHTCAGVNATQATRWSAHARTLGLAHARALGRCSTFAAADHTEARDPAPRTASPGRARTVARRCTRVRVRVGGAGRTRSKLFVGGVPQWASRIGRVCARTQVTVW